MKYRPVDPGRTQESHRPLPLTNNRRDIENARWLYDAARKVEYGIGLRTSNRENSELITYVLVWIFFFLTSRVTVNADVLELVVWAMTDDIPGM